MSVSPSSRAFQSESSRTGDDHVAPERGRSANTISLADELFRLRNKVDELDNVRRDNAALKEALTETRLELQALRTALNGHRRDVEQSVLLLADTLQGRTAALEQSVHGIEGRISRWLNVAPFRWARAVRRRLQNG
ncbi:MAG: hypothetical protein IT290_01775 [Deltaproteobacteria bacterium]|nr:hypothetical protein [Deltaproteobacteria bacterium]